MVIVRYLGFVITLRCLWSQRIYIVYIHMKVYSIVVLRPTSRECRRLPPLFALSTHRFKKDIPLDISRKSMWKYVPVVIYNNFDTVFCLRITLCFSRFSQNLSLNERKLVSNNQKWTNLVLELVFQPNFACIKRIKCITQYERHLTSMSFDSRSKRNRGG